MACGDEVTGMVNNGQRGHCWYVLEVPRKRRLNFLVNTIFNRIWLSSLKVPHSRLEIGDFSLPLVLRVYADSWIVHARQAINALPAVYNFRSRIGT
jgi:hypothetical protein